MVHSFFVVISSLMFRKDFLFLYQLNMGLPLLVFVIGMSFYWLLSWECLEIMLIQENLTAGIKKTLLNYVSS